MKTRRVFNTPGHAHELTFSCYHRLPLLNRDRTRLWLVESLGRIRSSYDVDLIAYVIMPEHAHVLIRPRQPDYQIELISKSFKQSVARRALAHLRENSPAFLERLAGERNGRRLRYHFWQPGGGYDRNVFNAEPLTKWIDYLHGNPVRRRLVAHPTDWRWSSARAYAGLDDVPLTMDRIAMP